MVDHILDIELIENSSCDLNQSGQCDIADTILLIDIIKTLIDIYDIPMNSLFVNYLKYNLYFAIKICSLLI